MEYEWRQTSHLSLSLIHILMAKQIEQLNKIYTRMIDARTINMRVAAPHVTSEE